MRVLALARLAPRAHLRLLAEPPCGPSRPLGRLRLREGDVRGGRAGVIDTALPAHPLGRGPRIRLRLSRAGRLRAAGRTMPPWRHRCARLNPSPTPFARSGPSASYRILAPQPGNDARPNPVGGSRGEVLEKRSVIPRRV